MTYLIRHARKVDSSVRARLTEDGKRDSYLYGKELKERGVEIDLIISSPIERCIETAEKISDGYGDVPIELSRLLGDAGIFIDNAKSAMEVFERYRLVDIINMQLQRRDLDGFVPINIASQRLIDFISSQRKNTIMISHDAIITPFIAYINGIKSIKERDIVDYLNGYLLTL